MSSLFMLVGDIRLRKSDSVGLWRICLRSEMQTQEFFANLFCSEEFHQGLDNQILSLSVVNILLGITGILGNAIILIALHKETFLGQASKVLLSNLVASDLCVGFVQIAYGVDWISIIQGRWQICRRLFLVWGIAACISITVSLLTITAISVDRLLALLLKLRYRQVVTIRKVYAVAIASWICNGVGISSLWCFSFDGWEVLDVMTIVVCLTKSMCCYSRIFFMLRDQRKVQINLREKENQTTRVAVIRYRKTVSSAVWLQLALLFCYLPYMLLAPFAHRQYLNNRSSALSNALSFTITLMCFNSTLNPILYFWRIKEIRRAVKDTLSCSRM
ncbi:melanocortin receptor 3-like [Acropora millepora]|uniref:melanocortin receptor 3-like n=1 Tax=Acropora millepora TaxID=45264 RepID=UPI001CF3E6C1|nr:melanocortin receptor 3-like [Acropora millepora]